MLLKAQQTDYSNFSQHADTLLVFVFYVTLMQSSVPNRLCSSGLTLQQLAVQCTKLVEEFGIVHLSAGDLLRAHMKSGSPDGNMVAQMIKDGQIVPSHVTISLLQKAMADSGQDKFLIDGFPRNDENRNAFEQQVQSTLNCWGL